MDQKSVVLYSPRKDVVRRAIHSDLVATLCLEAVNYSSVTHYLREAILAASNPTARFHSQQPSSRIAITRFSSPLSNNHWRQFDSWRDSLPCQEPRCTGVSLNRGGFGAAIFDGYPILCHTLKSRIVSRSRESFSPHCSDWNDDRGTTS
jgi:hypothetical protein